MKFVFVIGFLIIGASGFAQLKGFSVGPFAEIARPVGNFKGTHKNGYGAGLGADIRFGKIGLTGSVGYMQFGGKSIHIEGEQVDYSALKAVPIRVGLKYRFIPAFYGKLESGVAKFTGGNESAFIISPGIGARILGLDVQAKYEIWKADQTYYFVGLKAGFNF